LQETTPIENILDDDRLYRRLAPMHMNNDGSVNSGAFKVKRDYDQSISVDLARLTTPEATMGAETRPGFRIGALVARIPRALGFVVRHDPVPEDRAHSLIEGENNKNKSRELARAMTVLQNPRT